MYTENGKPVRGKCTIYDLTPNMCPYEADSHSWIFTENVFNICFLHLLSDKRKCKFGMFLGGHCVNGETVSIVHASNSSLVHLRLQK